jgi:phage host-nuclease inhibitor protein Gam
MAKRKRVDIEIIKSLDEAKTALAEIAGLTREKSVIEAEMNAVIDNVKAAGESKARPLLERIKELEEGLAAFAEVNKEALFEKKKTVDLVFGCFGFRRSTEIKPLPKTTMAQVLERLKDAGKRAKAALRVTTTVNKEELRTWTDAELLEVGARRVTTDKFWYEIADTELKNEEAA